MAIKTAGSKTTAGKKSAPLDPKVADKLLDLLSTDNEFRRLFKKDPLSALAKAGYKPSKEEAVAAAHKGSPVIPSDPSPWKCCRVDRIAPKSDIIRTRTKLKEMLTAGLAQNPIHLDATDKASLRTRK